MLYVTFLIKKSLKIGDAKLWHFRPSFFKKNKSQSIYVTCFYKKRKNMCTQRQKSEKNFKKMRV